MKLEMRSLGPPFRETIGLSAKLRILVSVQNSGVLGGFCLLLSHLNARFANVFVDIHFIDYKFGLVC